MSITRVKEYFKKYNMEERVIELTETTATVSQAALALNCEEDMIAKTLSFFVDEKPIVIVLSGQARLDNAKYKKEFGKKAKMISPEIVEKVIGHQVGGVCPFAINEGVRVFLDNSLKKHDFIYPACGSSNSAIKLSIEELEKYSNFEKWIDISK